MKRVINHCQQCIVHIALTKIEIADQCRMECVEYIYIILHCLIYRSNLIDLVKLHMQLPRHQMDRTSRGLACLIFHLTATESLTIDSLDNTP